MASVVFVLDGDRVLLLQWVKPLYRGLWSGLGGSVELGESPEEAALREVWEESGLTVNKLSLRGHLVLQWPEREDATSLHIFVAERWEGQLRGSLEGLPEWVSLKDLHRYPLVPCIKDALPLVLVPDTFLSGTVVLKETTTSFQFQHFRVTSLGTYMS